ncbi:MAG: sterol desaturase family protein [Planctomycetota bacterium]|nr:sterol desaturase family protein [Planctomycetota bacterium]
MLEDHLSILSPIVAALSLAGLWILELVLTPIIEHRRVLGSARLRNLALAGLNVLVAVSIAGLVLLVTEASSRSGIGLLHQARQLLPDSMLLGVFLLFTSFLLLDFWGYVFHVLAHRMPLLWRFHALHHNADRFEVTLAVRFHAVEIAVQALASLPIYYIMGISIQEILIYQLFLVPLAFFHHWNVRLPALLERTLCLVLVTPGMHVIHHSRWDRETDSNYAPIFSFWDRLFGSYRWRDRPETVSVGLDGFDSRQINTLRGMLSTGIRSSPSEPGTRPPDELIPEKLIKRERN